MADTKQLQILKALTAQLETVQLADGTLMTGKVLRGVALISASTPLPVLSFIELGQPTNGAPAGNDRAERNEQWNIWIQGFAADDKKNPSDPAYNLKGLAEQALFKVIQETRQGDPMYPELYRLGGLINGLTIGQGVVRPPDKEVSATAYFYLPLTIEFVSDVSDPFAA